MEVEQKQTNRFHQILTSPKITLDRIGPPTLETLSQRSNEQYVNVKNVEYFQTKLFQFLKV
jgi:hypothetical protein